MRGAATSVDPDIARATASVQMARAILLGASAYAQDPEVLAGRFGLSPPDLGDADGRLPSRVVVAMWDEVPRIVGDDRFGLRLGLRASQAGTLPVVGYVIQTSPTLGEGLARALRYQRLVQTLNRAELVTGRLDARIVFHVSARHVERLRHAIEFAAAFCMAFAGRLLGRRVVPSRVCFAHAPPSALDEHRSIFGEKIAFQSAATEIALDPALLALPLPSADEGLGEIVERHAAALLARVPNDDSFARAVRAALAGTLAKGRGAVAEVARRLHMSPRTLQRRLQAEGTSGVELLDDVRRELALHYVADMSLSLAEVAFLLGFSDQTTFHRAFIRWTGKPPGALRELREPREPRELRDRETPAASNARAAGGPAGALLPEPPRGLHFKGTHSKGRDIE